MGASKSQDNYTNPGVANISKQILKNSAKISKKSRISNLEVKIPSSAIFGDWFNYGWEIMHNDQEFDTLVDQELADKEIHNDGKETIPTSLHIDILMNGVDLESHCSSFQLSFDVSADCFTWYERGRDLEETSCYDEAVICYYQALQLEPQLIEAWNRLGGIFSDNLHRYEDALACFNQALRLNYLDDLAWFNRGNVLEIMECYEDAIASYDLAIKLNPSDEASWYGRGWSQYCIGELSGAIASFQEAIKLKSTDDSAWYNQACCYALQQNTSQAVACLRQAIRLSPNQYRQMAKTEADFDEIRAEASFVELMVQIG